MPKRNFNSHKFMVTVHDNVYQKLAQDAKDRGLTVQERVRELLGDKYVPDSEK